MSRLRKSRTFAAMQCTPDRAHQIQRALRIICATVMIRTQQVSSPTGAVAPSGHTDQWQEVLELRQEQLRLGNRMVKQLHQFRRKRNHIYLKHTCANCLITIPETLKCCSKCYDEHYCSTSCQRQDYMRHRPLCMAKIKQPGQRHPGWREKSLEWKHLRSDDDRV